MAREGAVDDVNEGRPMADVHLREIDLLMHPNRPRLCAFENRNEDEIIEFGVVLNEPVEEKEDSDSQQTKWRCAYKRRTTFDDGLVK